MFVELPLVLILVLLGTTAWAAVSAAPYVPMRRGDVGRFVSVLNPRAGETVYDLGCGDGRVLLAILRRQPELTKAVGIDLSLLSLLLANLTMLKAGSLRPKVSLRWRSLWRVPLTEASSVCLFLMPKSLTRLAPKLRRELKPGSKVVSYCFPIPRWTPKAVSRVPGAANIYLYEIPNNSN